MIPRSVGLALFLMLAGGVVHAAATPPKAIETPAPEYPKEEEDAGHGGRVVLKFKVSETGAVESVEVATSTGYPKLDEAALAAGRNWKFQPAKDETGKAVAGEKSLALSFKPTGAGGKIADTCAELNSQVAAYKAAQPEGDITQIDTFAATTGMLFMATASQPAEARLAAVKRLQPVYVEVAARCATKPEAKYFDVVTETIAEFKKAGK